MHKEKIDESISYLKKNITGFPRGRKFREIGISFVSVECARETSIKPLYGCGFILLPSYMGYRLDTSKMSEIPK